MGYLLCGLNGAGKSTIACRLAQNLHIRYLDIEVFYFPNRFSNQPYSTIRTKDEVQQLLISSFKQGDFILASVDANFQEEVLRYIDQIIIIDVPKEIRLQRVKERSFKQFRKRMLPGGDMYEQEEKFFQRVARKDESLIKNSLPSYINVTHIDGTGSLDEIVDSLMHYL